MAKFRVSFWRKWFIKRHFFQWSLYKPEGFMPNKKLFLKLKHPAELHYLSEIYNWDDGSTVLEWVLESNLCSKATANLLFWRAAPDWYLKFDPNDLESCPVINRDGFRVIQKVLKKYKDNNFSEFQIEFDPAKEIEEITSKDRKWEVPNEMYEKLSGLKVV
ncbi:hypothetical protein CBP51_08255 [Cellvibrio mixtus]|uniref:DUF4274 domain-containing protein n=1 Tax=Cellvibrio mixtus TaxID=39650 RepID=A0A266QAY8_9GAMM|nr:DUF4274 domain-containing protein [Cellvibrio mixtus]OZY86970.1 hypothetical protein CBP51_08255 [Cellvibrio mixtus]